MDREAIKVYYQSVIMLYLLSVGFVVYTWPYVTWLPHLMLHNSVTVCTGRCPANSAFCAIQLIPYLASVLAVPCTHAPVDCMS